MCFDARSSLSSRRPFEDLTVLLRGKTVHLSHGQIPEGTLNYTREYNQYQVHCISAADCVARISAFDCSEYWRTLFSLSYTVHIEHHFALCFHCLIRYLLNITLHYAFVVLFSFSRLCFFLIASFCLCLSSHAFKTALKTFLFRSAYF